MVLGCHLTYRLHVTSTADLIRLTCSIGVAAPIAAPRGAAEVAIRVNGQEAARGTVPRTAALAFTANDAFDVGTDSYSPVSQAYFDRKPFKFNGAIEAVRIKYLK